MLTRAGMSQKIRFKKQYKPIGFGDRPDPSTVEGHRKLLKASVTSTDVPILKARPSVLEIINCSGAMQMDPGPSLALAKSLGPWDKIHGPSLNPDGSFFEISQCEAQKLDILQTDSRE